MIRVKKQTIIVSALVLLGLAFLVIGVNLKKAPPVHTAHSLRSFQDADAPPGYPVAEGADFRTASFAAALHRFSGVERYLTPTARAFSSVRGEGEQVLAPADGLVVYAGDELLVLNHRLPDERMIQSLHGPLVEVEFRVGELVGRGMVLGQLTDGERRFEWREQDGVVLAGTPQLDFAELLAAYPALGPHSPLALMLMESGESELELDPESAKKLSEILEGP